MQLYSKPISESTKIAFISFEFCCISYHHATKLKYKISFLQINKTPVLNNCFLILIKVRDLIVFCCDIYDPEILVDLIEDCFKIILLKSFKKLGFVRFISVRVLKRSLEISRSSISIFWTFTLRGIKLLQIGLNLTVMNWMLVFVLFVLIFVVFLKLC